MSRIVVVLLLCAFAALGQNFNETPKRRSTFWKASVAALVASSIADAQSSIGRVEANPILRGPAGRFSGRSVAMKAGITGVAIGMQWLFLRKSPEGEKNAARINFAMAGAFTAAATYNHVIHRAVSPPLPAARPVAASFEVAPR
ncbi:MAG: hypothetical protein U0Q16_01580 [Bryobacteraceae bacterium]